ncbi:MAG: SDR family oxidoreductase [Thermodesulfovibrionales bacterium]|nr:SDR family oxidoreductase [Thermodesulfovibrionales bacterium]
MKGTFSLKSKVAVITGGAGLLGLMHAEAVAEAGGTPVLADIKEVAAKKAAKAVSGKYKADALGIGADITDRGSVQKLLRTVLRKFGRVDILINNAAIDPKVKAGDDRSWSRFENFPIKNWDMEISVGLTGAFLCSQVIGSEMAKRGGGVILNISSDLGVIAPDQRLYVKEGLPPDKQPVKPVTYSVIKHGLLGLTKYIATYWADKNIRCNALSPGGVYTGQPDEFLKRISSRIPMGRMARRDEYKGAVLFLVSDASSYMTGANLIVDGGRTCW